MAGATRTASRKTKRKAVKTPKRKTGAKTKKVSAKRKAARKKTSSAKKRSTGAGTRAKKTASSSRKRAAAAGRKTSAAKARKVKSIRERATARSTTRRTAERSAPAVSGPGLAMDGGDALDWLIEQLAQIRNWPASRIGPGSYVNAILGNNDDWYDDLWQRVCARWRQIDYADFLNAADGDTVGQFSQFIQ